MWQIELEHTADFEGWRLAAKAAAMAGVPPENLVWRIKGEGGDLFSQTGIPAVAADALRKPTVRPAFINLCRAAICHSDPERFSLLYRLLLRLQKEKQLLDQPTDADVDRANRLARNVRRDSHKMKAFVRFRQTGETETGVEQFVAWFEPEHHVLRFTAPFFVRRFANMHWSILTPESCAHWNGTVLTFSPGVSRDKAPKDDDLEDFWRTYYASIFNPARLKVQAMQSEMPKKYWQNLPEAQLIPDLIRNAESREKEMREADATVPKPGMMAHRAMANETPIPRMNEIHGLESLEATIRGCRRCPLWEHATQAVCGRGPADAPLMLIGEQPGDVEDLTGEPFVGPAGQLLRKIMHETGIEPDNTFITNAVKHFKFEPRGKRRLHKNPNASEIEACRFWLMKEIELVAPRVIVSMGGSAYRSLTGQEARIGRLRGKPFEFDQGIGMLVTYHPSYVLRVPEGPGRERARQALADDLLLASRMVQAD